MNSPDAENTEPPDAGRSAAPRPASNSKPVATTSPTRRTGCCCLVAFGMLVIGTLLVIHQFRQPLPPELTRAIFDSAWERWQANAPANYSIEVQVVGPQPAIYAVTVQEGLVVSATRNGNPLPANPRTMRTWSVPGMFDTMEFDVMRLEKPEPSYLRLRARFDEHLGFPAQYHRDDNQNQFQMRWTVTEFEER